MTARRRRTGEGIRFNLRRAVADRYPWRPRAAGERGILRLSVRKQPLAGAMMTPSSWRMRGLFRRRVARRAGRCSRRWRLVGLSRVASRKRTCPHRAGRTTRRTRDPLLARSSRHDGGRPVLLAPTSISSISTGWGPRCSLRPARASVVGDACRRRRPERGQTAELRAGPASDRSPTGLHLARFTGRALEPSVSLTTGRLFVADREGIDELTIQDPGPPDRARAGVIRSLGAGRAVERAIRRLDELAALLASP